MPAHFSITYKEGFASVEAWLRQQSAANPLLAFREGPVEGFWIVATPSKELARWQQENLDAGSTVSPSLCVIEIIPKHGLVHVNLECMDAAQSTAADLIRAMLKQFPGGAIYDADRDKAISNPDELFAS